MGLEPTPGPWQGPVLPLYYDRPKQENSITAALRRQDIVKLRQEHSVGKHKTNGVGLFPLEIHPRHPTGSADLQHSRGLNDRRLPLALGKFGGLGAVGINAREPLAVLVKDRDLPVLVFAPLIFPVLRALSWSFCFCHRV